MVIGRVLRCVTAMMVVGGGVLLVTAVPAGATIDKNTIGCSGSGVITRTDGSQLTIDATQATAHVPRKAGRVTYQGAVTTTTHNHHGYVAVKTGPFKFTFYTWKGANNSNKNQDSGTRKYPAALADVPPGEYQLTGGHFAPEGSCTGHMTIIIDGSPLSSPFGLGALIGGIAFAALTALAGLTGHPITGAITGLLAGVFGAGIAMFWALTALTTPVAVGVPVVGLLVGVGVGLLGKGVKARKVAATT